MKQMRFTPDAWDRSILKTQMESFVRLVARVDYLTDLNTARAALRVLEAAARRMLLVLALKAPRLKPHAPRRMPLTDQRRIEVRAGTPRQPSRLFRLTEPMPGYGAMARALDPPDRGPKITRIALTDLGLARHTQRPDAPARLVLEDIHPWDRVMARLDALKDVAQRPDHHANRMRCWLARQQGLREANRLARPSPLLPGRPLALKKGDHLHPTRRPHDEGQRLLYEFHELANLAQGPPYTSPHGSS